MKFCSKCGKELLDEAVVCPGCGCAQKNEFLPNTADSSSFGWALLGFFIPIVGLILYLVWKDSTPLRAKSVGKGAMIGVIVPIVYVVCVIILALIFTLLTGM